MKNTKAKPASAPAADAGSPNSLFVALRALLLPYIDRLAVVHDSDEHFYVNCRNLDAKGKAQFFGAVKRSGRKHVFHFMPAYDFPESLAGLSPALKKRMQGKSCFNFDALDPDLLHELQGVITQGAARYQAAGKL